MTARTHVSSADPMEDAYGYARAVRAGDIVFVSGTTARGDSLRMDTYGQATAALSIIADALADAGASLADVVRTVVYVTDLADVDLVARAHHEAFARVRPASTLVQVSALTPPDARVEIEVTAVSGLVIP